jgi:hypothetical protein
MNDKTQFIKCHLCQAKVLQDAFKEEETFLQESEFFLLHKTHFYKNFLYNYSDSTLE